MSPQRPRARAGRRRRGRPVDGGDASPTRFVDALEADGFVFTAAQRACITTALSRYTEEQLRALEEGSAPADLAADLNRRLSACFD